MKMKTIHDQITGLDIEVSDEPWTEYWIVSKDRVNGLGWPYGYAWAPTLAEAKRRQLELGVRNESKIVKIESKW